MLTTLGLVYAFSVGRIEQFDVNVKLKGWIPLFGGREGEANVDLIVKATGVDAKEAGDQAVLSEITSMKATAFGSTLPLNTNNVEQFFPKSTAQFRANGKVLSNDAPDIKLPVKLPGLDSKRLAEISYLPLELPSGSETYSFERNFSGVLVKYSVKSLGVVDGIASFDIKLSQSETGFEDNFGNATEQKEGIYATESTLVGSGSATWNLKRALFTKVQITSVNTTNLKPLKPNKKAKSRILETQLTIQHKSDSQR